MADALLLASQRVRPVKLLAAGYSFHFEDLEPALRAILVRSARR
jgi:NAD dependent epimerase/dehydratase family enzyme